MWSINQAFKRFQTLQQKSSKLTYVNTILNTYDHTQQQLNPDPVEKIDEWFPYQSKISESCTDISWFWKLEHIGIMPEENEPTVLQQFTKNISYVQTLASIKTKALNIGKIPCK